MDDYLDKVSNIYFMDLKCTNCDHHWMMAVQKGTMLSINELCPNCGCKTGMKDYRDKPKQFKEHVDPNIHFCKGKSMPTPGISYGSAHCDYADCPVNAGWAP